MSLLFCRIILSTSSRPSLTRAPVQFTKVESDGDGDGDAGDAADDDDDDDEDDSAELK